MSSDRRTAESVIVPVFALAIFASAFLIFLVQPMVGKHILPWFGGAPGVWTLCLAFYQTSLFAGYAYAHGLVARVSPSRQMFIHALLFVAAVAVLPVLPEATWKPEPGQDPSARILSMLAANVAPPFVLLAATGPLLQAWFIRALPGRSPYALYAVSNAGSLLALLAFPILFEPLVSLSSTASLWTVAFVACGLLVLVCGRLALAPELVPSPGDLEAGAAPEEHEEVVGPALDSRLDPLRFALWVGLAASAVVLFMGVTNELCLDVASVPFLWILPLGLYLVTFILCFGSEASYRPRAMGTLAIVAGLMIVGLKLGPDDLPGIAAGRSLQGQIALHSALLFGGCMLMHGELYRLRPPAKSLTLFYLCVSGGGALGGLFVGLAAPNLFTGYWELPLGVFACWTGWIAARWRDESSTLRRTAWVRGVTALTTIALIAAGAAGYLRVRRNDTVRLQERNFFGILRVTENHHADSRRERRTLHSGRTLHGTQLLHPAALRRPTAYFGVASAVGMVLDSRTQGEDQRVAIIGLGAGTLAAYGRKGDTIRFYEIDPDVIRLARDEGLFSFLSDSDAQIEVVEGDARLSLEAEVREGDVPFDVLVVDAFSSDAIPVHLLTREALALYAKRVRDDGLLLMHVSNKHLELVPLVYRVGASAGFYALEVMNRQVSHHLTERSTWVVLSRDPARVESAAINMRERSGALKLERGVLRIGHPEQDKLAQTPLWTDDYSNLFGVLKR